MARQPSEWLFAAHNEDYVECHTRTGAQCAGAAIYRANVCKLPRNEDLLRLPTDRVHVFASPREFIQHHDESSVEEILLVGETMRRKTKRQGGDR